MSIPPAVLKRELRTDVWYASRAGKICARLKKMPHTKLLIAGDGPQREALQKQIDNMGLSSQVILTGALEQDVLHGYIRAADVFVLNSTYEGFSHLLLEVMALDIPIVTTNVGGNPELITNGKEGVLVDPYNNRMLASAIKKILTDTSFAQLLKRNGRNRIKQFSEKDMIARLMTILQ